MRLSTADALLLAVMRGQVPTVGWVFGAKGVADLAGEGFTSAVDGEPDEAEFFASFDDFFGGKRAADCAVVLGFEDDDAGNVLLFHGFSNVRG